MGSLIPAERIERSILLVRGHKVMPDADLAELYGVSTKVLNQAVKRNKDRFPSDFMFQLNQKEFDILRSQFVTSNKGRGGRRYAPLVFTEQGIAMLSTVLNSEHAIQVNIEIMRAFVRLREIMSTYKDLACKLEALEKKYDSQFKVVFDAIRQLMFFAIDPVAAILRDLNSQLLRLRCDLQRGVGRFSLIQEWRMLQLYVIFEFQVEYQPAIYFS